MEEEEEAVNPDPKRIQLETISELERVHKEISQKSTPIAERTCKSCLDADLANIDLGSSHWDQLHAHQ